MKQLVKYFFNTLIIVQGLFLAIYFLNYNFMGLLSWFGKGDSVNTIKLLSPLIVYGTIKVLYWIADPFSKLFTILLKWGVAIGIFYLFYWLFFV